MNYNDQDSDNDDKELVEFLKSKAKWPGSSSDTFRQTCGGKHANMHIDVANSEERKRFCQLISSSTIWQSALSGTIDLDRRKSYEIVTTGKRIDCLTQVFPKTDFKFAFMTTSCSIDLNKLIDSIPKEFGRFYLFQRSPIESLNEEFPVYQCYFTDCQFRNVESFQNVLKQIETSSGCKMDRRIYTNCIQFPGCFVTNTPTNENAEKSFFRWIKITDSNFEPPSPEDLILTHHHENTIKDSIVSPTPRKRQKTFHSFESDQSRFVDAWIYFLIHCPRTSEIYDWPGCLISQSELLETFHKRRPMMEFDDNLIRDYLIDKWGFVCTKTISSQSISSHSISSPLSSQSIFYFLIPSRDRLFQSLQSFNLEQKRNLNSFVNSINKRDLTIDYSLYDDTDTIDSLTDSVTDSTDSSGEPRHKGISCLFQNFEREFENLLNKYDCFVGCVAWLNDLSLIQLMKGKSLGMVVTKDPKNWVDDNLRDHLNKMPFVIYPVTSGVHPGTRFDETKEDSEMAGMLRCVGDRSQSEDFILMHNKFLVFGDKIDNDRSSVGFVFQPKCVWTGSRNFTFAAKRHKENAVIIKDEKIARAYYLEWANLYLNSEPINTDQLSFSPFDYFVV